MVPLLLQTGLVAKIYWTVTFVVSELYKSQNITFRSWTLRFWFWEERIPRRSL